MLNLTTVFELLGVSRKAKQPTAKALFPALYTLWLGDSGAETVQETKFSNLISGRGAKRDVPATLACFGLTPETEENSESLFQARVQEVMNGLAGLTELPASSLVLESLWSCLDEEIRASEDPERRRALQSLTRLLRVEPDTAQAMTPEQLAQIKAYYLILSVTALKRPRGNAAAAAAAIRRHSEATGFTTQSLVDQARNLYATGQEEAAFQALELSWDTEQIGGMSDYEQARFQRQKIDRAKTEAERAYAIKFYQIALNGACGSQYPLALIERARERFLGNLYDRNPDQCLTDCGTILLSGGMPQRVTGEALWLLYQLMESGHEAALAFAEEQKLGDAGQVLEKACEQNWRAAIELRSQQRARDSVSLVRVLRHEDSPEYGTAFFNGSLDSELAEILRRTIPVHWELKPLDRRTLSRELAGSGDTPLRFLLLGEDEEKNLKDALVVLQTLKQLHQLDPRCVSVFLGGAEERVAPLIDTAQEHMDGRIIPVTILDQEKTAAQQLLSRHPLFYPIRDVKSVFLHSGVAQQNDRIERSHTLHFVITGDSRCCEWLVREAYWMMTFREQYLVRIRPVITVIAPKASELVDRVFFRCPGMESGAEGGVEIRAKDLGFLSEEYRKAVVSVFTAENSSCYFAVDMGSDLENLEHAIRLRETLTRVWIRHDMTKELEEPPVIAFRCEDSDLSKLSRETVVLNENLGSAWYNHYRLIPFGSAYDRASWQQLSENTQERVSFCGHLQYYRLDEDGPGEPSREEKWKAAWRDYYRRSYNRESSLGVALSLPYRLFNSHFAVITNHHGGETAVGLLPERWNILDPDTFWSGEARERFADVYDSAVRDREEETVRYVSRKENEYNELRAIAEWEHERWNRYMISRGWVTAKVQQTIDYRNAGNGRWQLYLGRMHPCIAPFDDLSWTAKVLDQEEDYFMRIDMRNICATGSLLRGGAKEN